MFSVKKLALSSLILASLRYSEKCDIISFTTTFLVLQLRVADLQGQNGRMQFEEGL